MAKGVLRIGDSSNHSGNVIGSGDGKVTIGGIPIATVGSSVSGDAEDHPPNNIATPGCSGVTTAGGRQVACNGALTACGGAEAASQTRTTIGK